jgi:hypothetical protein
VSLLEFPLSRRPGRRNLSARGEQTSRRSYHASQEFHSGFLMDTIIHRHASIQGLEESLRRLRTIHGIWMAPGAVLSESASRSCLHVRKGRIGHLPSGSRSTLRSSARARANAKTYKFNIRCSEAATARRQPCYRQCSGAQPTATLCTRSPEHCRSTLRTSRSYAFAPTIVRCGPLRFSSIKT